MFSEQAIIHNIAAQIPHPDYLRHDTFYDAKSRLIYTTDMLVEHQHFDLAYFSPEDLGWKAAAVNASDIAATGGAMKFLLISLGLPNNLPTDFVSRFYTGMQALLAETGGQIVGGDTVGSEHLVINVTAVGELPSGAAPGRRDQAQPGDVIVTTGPAGLSAVGLWALQQRVEGYPESKKRHLRPIPRLKEGQLFSKQTGRFAMMDSSDGLADALLKISEASDVDLCLHVDKLSVHSEVKRAAAQQKIGWLDLMLYGGEDFELVATCAALPEGLQPFFTVLGEVKACSGASSKAVVLDSNGQIQQALGYDKTYQHFKG